MAARAVFQHQQPLLVIGAGTLGRAVTAAINSQVARSPADTYRENAFRVVGVFDDSPAAQTRPSPAQTDRQRATPPLKVRATSQLRSFVSAFDCHTVLLAEEDADEAQRQATACVAAGCTSLINLSGARLSLPPHVAIQEGLEPGPGSRYAAEMEELERIGKGGFGSVFRCRSRMDKQVYAVKKALLRAQQGQIEKQAKEAEAIARMSKHTHIVRYYSSWWERGCMAAEESSVDTTASSSETGCWDGGRQVEGWILYIQMELCDGGTLAPHLMQGNMSDAEVRHILIQILRACAHIHGCGYVHCDLKPTNCFFHQGVLKVGDFGLCKSVEGELEGQEDHSDQGTYLYAAPEQQRHSASCDVFSVGMIWFEMLCKFQTGMERATMMLKCRERELDATFLAKYPSEASVILQMTHPDPEERPGINQVLTLLQLQQQQPPPVQQHQQMEAEIHLLRQQLMLRDQHIQKQEGIIQLLRQKR